MDDPVAYRLEEIDALEIPLTESIRQHAAAKELADLRPRQRVLFALLTATLDDIHEFQKKWWLNTIVSTPLCIALGVVVVYALLDLCGLVMGWFSIVVGQWILYSYYVIPLVMGGLLGLMIKNIFENNAVDFARNEKTRVATHLDLGRLSGVLDTYFMQAMAALFGMTVAGQIFVIHNLPDHAGLAIDGELQTSVLLTLDSICHGVFLDLFELYDISIGEKVKHTTMSATVFFLFRTAFDAYVVIMMVIIYRRYKLKTLLAGYPAGKPTVIQLTQWLGGICNEDHSWPRNYFDEFMFLALCRYYFLDDLEFVNKASGQFPRLRITAQVRYLFTNQENHLVLAFMWDDEMANPGEELGNQ
ncbi:hypothetical protein [Zavarzinella formosa]|uniref:hypothetical protein n=1 Tax=Zavarzinella formosa TaxID=360055 RepID=UPI0012F7E10F|nr:hypothetical protein [Zavarzinella formosa]